MESLELLIQKSVDEGDAIEREIFDTSEPRAIAERLERFLEKRLAPFEQAIFYRRSVGIVLGARLTDSREVVLKVNRWGATVDKLVAVQRVQRELSILGLPMPRPLVAPEGLGTGIATVEELVDGEVADGHDPDIRRVLAEELCRLVEVSRPMEGIDELGSPVLLRPSDAPLWPTPHSPHFNFEATAKGAEWIDQLATLARQRLANRSDERVVGHFDWRVGNLGFVGSRLVAIYDSDSLALAPESVIVGNAAAAFSMDWSRPDGSLPDLAEMKAFVAAYEHARGGRFDDQDRDILDAANLAHVAYGARCQWSNHVLFPDASKDPWATGIGQLRQRGEHGLLTP